MSDASGAPIEPVEPGTSILVGSEDVEQAKRFAAWLLLQAAGPDDGLLLANPDTPGDELLAICARIDPTFDSGSVKLIDCTGEPEPDPEQAIDLGPGSDVDLGDEPELLLDDEDGDEDEFDVSVEYLPSGDLTELGVSFSVAHENLVGGESDRVLTGMTTISSIVERTDLRTAIRFVKTIAARVNNDGGLVVFVADLSAHDDKTVAALSQVVDGFIRVRTAGDGEEIRIQGLDGQPEGWLPIALPD